MTTQDEQSVSVWIRLLRGGESAAVRPLWDRYFRPLVHYARRKAKGRPQLEDQAEDMALSAFHSFCNAAMNGRFPDLLDRNELWKLLAVITSRKVNRQARDQARLKRGGGRTVQLLDSQGTIQNYVIDDEPTPESYAVMREELDRLVHVLHDPVLKRIALLTLDSYGIQEIAEQLGYTRRSIHRKLRLIRGIWEHYLDPDHPLHPHRAGNESPNQSSNESSAPPSA